MNQALHDLLEDHGLLAGARPALRIELALAYARRVRHLLENERAIELLDAGRDWLIAGAPVQELGALAQEAAALARSHPGSRSIDGAAHAAVSATHAVAAALAGRVLDAAGYSAYAAVYAYSASAVTSPEAFESEHAWQLGAATRLLCASAAAGCRRFGMDAHEPAARMPR